MLWIFKYAVRLSRPPGYVNASFTLPRTSPAIPSAIHYEAAPTTIINRGAAASRINHCSQKVSPQYLILLRRANIIRELLEFVMIIVDLLEVFCRNDFKLAKALDVLVEERSMRNILVKSTY